MIFWTRCDDVVSLSDSELERWKLRGVDGFVCQIGHLRGLGGSQDFTGDASADLRGPNYDFQRRLRDSDVVKRARRRGIKTYLGFYVVNPSNRATPLAEWFDDRAWSTVVLPRLTRSPRRPGGSGSRAWP
jgi:hypothetical protein